MQITRPKTMMLGNIPGTDIYRDLQHYREAVNVPGFLILSIDAPINFANTTYLKERLLFLTQIQIIKHFMTKHITFHHHFSGSQDGFKTMKQKMMTPKTNPNSNM